MPQVVAELRVQRRVVLVAEPGAGKTTRVPPAILADSMLSAEHPRLLMLQPRRVAARASAARIAAENGWQLGRQVGYQVRGDKRLAADTPLQILTEAILTRRLMDDPFLEGVGCVVLDEFHERHIDSDLCLAMLREISATVRDDLRLVVMSATLDAKKVADFLGGCPVLEVPGRVFAVRTIFAPLPTTPQPLKLPQHVANQVRRVLDEQPHDAGDILVFLPGMEDIRRTARELETLAASRDLAILPLHGSLPFEAQTQVLEPMSRRKVILSTNIAETSLTIDGVRTVIDCGLARVPGYDARRGMDKLELKRISRASATQRAGRAGRTAPGQCIRLWSSAEDKNLQPFDLPEVQRVDLCSAILQVHQWGKSDPRNFGWFDAPLEHSIASAERTLAMLGALSSERDGQLTDLGARLVQIPAHPRLARMMIAAERTGHIREAAAIAALFSEKDIVPQQADFFGNRTRQIVGRSDVLWRLDLLSLAERADFAPHLRDQQIDPAAARQVARTRDDLIRSIGLGRGHAKPIGSDDEDSLLKLVLLAYPDRLCRRRSSSPDTATMVGGFGVKIAPTSTVTAANLFIAVDARDDARTNTRQAIANILSEVQEQWLEEMFPDLLTQTREVTFDDATGKVAATVITRFADLIIRERIDHHADPGDITAALAGLARKQAPALFANDKKAAQILERLTFLRHHMPERDWPICSDLELGEILADTCAGNRSLEQLKDQDLGELLLGHLDWKIRQALDEFAPETIAVPTGNRIRLEYSGIKQPALAVRLQEVFGWLATPRIAGGRVPLVMELLGPNYRPVQITSDLASFWRTTYFEVRKDLRVRYPKHAWPEDPLTATPEAKGRRRR